MDLISETLISVLRLPLTKTREYPTFAGGSFGVADVLSSLTGGGDRRMQALFSGQTSLNVASDVSVDTTAERRFGRDKDRVQLGVINTDASDNLFLWIDDTVSATVGFDLGPSEGIILQYPWDSGLLEEPVFVEGSASGVDTHVYEVISTLRPID